MVLVLAADELDFGSQRGNNRVLASFAVEYGPVDREYIVLVGYDVIALFFSIGEMDDAGEGYYLRENSAHI